MYPVEFHWMNGDTVSWSAFQDHSPKQVHSSQGAAASRWGINTEHAAPGLGLLPRPYTSALPFLLTQMLQQDWQGSLSLLTPGPSCSNPPAQCTSSMPLSHAYEDSDSARWAVLCRMSSLNTDHSTALRIWAVPAGLKAHHVDSPSKTTPAFLFLSWGVPVILKCLETLWFGSCCLLAVSWIRFLCGV